MCNGKVHDPCSLSGSSSHGEMHPQDTSLSTSSGRQAGIHPLLSTPCNSSRSLVPSLLLRGENERLKTLLLTMEDNGAGQGNIDQTLLEQVKVDYVRARTISVFLIMLSPDAGMVPRMWRALSLVG
ncbi:uncharacterized protein ACIGJ3_016665 isoform 1-T2 [Trichechus inunguis]